MRIRVSRRPLLLITGVLTLALAAPVASATSIHPGGLYISTGGGCPAAPTHPDTKAGRIATANTYLRSLVTHDTSDLQVAQSVVRWEEGGVTATGAKEICKGNQGPVTIEDAVIGMREVRWVVSDGDQAIAFYLLDSPTSPTYIAERFKVDHRLIQQIEAIFYIDVPGLAVGPESAATRPDGVTERVFASDQGPAGFFAPANHTGEIADPAPALRATVQSAAKAYLDALVAHNAQAVPLAPTVRRIENRRDRGSNASQIRAAIASKANKVDGITNLHIYVEGNQAVAMYRIATKQTDQVGLGGQVWGATRFLVQGGRITQIESICSSSELCGSTAG
jgi:hypothetical protein